jgi:hypothetical protein
LNHFNGSLIRAVDFHFPSCSQKDFTCDHWFNVNCAEATHYYDLNADPDKNPYTKDDKKKAAEAEALAQYKAQKYSDYY